MHESYFIMTRLRVLTLVGTICLLAASCKHDSYVVPVENRTGDPTLCFERDILPIFISECAKSGCHDAEEHEKGYVLDSYDNIMKKGIAPGNAIGSKIYLSLVGYTEERMPEDAPPLSQAKTDLIKRWIDAGALRDSNCYTPCDSNNFAYSSAIQPLVEKYCTGCHSGATPQGNLSLTSYDAVKSAVLSKNLVKCIKYEPGFSGMPKGGLKLSDCQVRQVEKWVAANMPNN